MNEYKKGNYQDGCDYQSEFFGESRNILTGYKKVQMEQRMLDLRLSEIAMEKSRAKYKSRKKTTIRLKKS